LRDLTDFIVACDIRATANASRQLRQRPPDMLAKSSFEQSRRSLGRHEQLTLAAVHNHHVRDPAIGGARTAVCWRLLQDASFFIRREPGTLGARTMGTLGDLTRKACSRPKTAA